MRAGGKLIAFFLFTSGILDSVGNSAPGLELHVATHGDDAHEGTKERPLATLHGAQRRIREIRQSVNPARESITVWLGAGKYFLSEPFHLEAEDSGTEEAPVVYSALPNAKARLIGGVEIIGWKPADDSDLAYAPPSEAQGRVFVTNLHQQGFADFGALNARGWNREMTPAAMELFQDDTRLELASWPNDGFATADTVAPDRRFRLPARVAAGLGAAKDAWAHGFWSYDYADSFLPLSKVDLPSRMATLAPSQDAPVLRPNARFRVVNSLAELDSRGEWYLDRESGWLYLWPAKSLTDSPVVASRLETPVSVYGASYITFRGLTIEAARVCDMEIAGGDHVSVENVELRHAGNLGLNIFGGQDHLVRGCEIHQCGEGGIRVEGGDRATLSEAGHEIVDCVIHDYARHSMAFRPAIDTHGVGIIARNNEIHSGGGPAIILQGNEHLVEKNRIHDVCRLAGDVGAIYLGHDPTFRGNIIRHNYLHDLGGFSRRDVVGVYLDDLASGATVFGNVLVRAGRAVVVGGGRDNSIENNLIVDCFTGVQIDNRGATWAKGLVQGENSFVARKCAEIAHDQAPYADRYPGLKRLLEDEPSLAKGNSVSANLIAAQYAIALHDGLDESRVTLTNNLNLGAERQMARAFMGGDEDSWEPRPRAAAAQIGFQRIPFERIGPRAKAPETEVASLP